MLASYVPECVAKAGTLYHSTVKPYNLAVRVFLDKLKRF